MVINFLLEMIQYAKYIVNSYFLRWNDEKMHLRCSLILHKKYDRTDLHFYKGCVHMIT